MVLAGANFRYAHSKSQDSDRVGTLSLEEPEAAEVNQVFDHLLLRKSAFSVCRTTEDFLFAQRTSFATLSLRKSILRPKELLCITLLEARYDPDFRFDLLWTLEQAPRARFPSFRGALSPYRFVNSVERVSPGREQDASGALQLTPPAWSKAPSRTTLRLFCSRQRRVEGARCIA